MLLAMTELPAAEQDLLVAHYVRGEEQAKLAERLGLSVRAVEAKLYRARKALHDRLQTVREEMK
ncbi:MAG: sigma factor-like helix-turn-helix DNA-binding protein [Phycisphaerales bacterium]